MLIDTGATFSLISTKHKNLFGSPVITRKLQGFNEAKSRVPFSVPVCFQLGTKQGKEQFGFVALDGDAIIGTDVLKTLGLIIDLVNKVLWEMRSNKIKALDQPIVIEAGYRLAAIKAIEEIKWPDWPAEVLEIAQKY